MNQRHYSPDQLNLQQRTSSLGKSSKRLREGGSTTKLLESTTRYCQEEIIIGDYSYKPSDEIGAGYSSRVYKAYGKNKQEFAIKVIQMKRFSASGLEMLEKEIEILRKLNHPNIIRLYHVHRTQTHTYLITQLCKSGDLQSYISRKGRLTEDIAGSIMAQVIEGVKYLMKMGIIHRDLKPANILRGDKIWKIADFGFSIISNEEIRTKQNVGTPLYMPIQSLLKNLYSPESDIFAIGVMYYELMIGVTPWECRSQKQLIKKLATVPFSVPQKYRISSHIRYLLQKMCSVELESRMKKEQFCELNLKNFVSLHNFNDPLLCSKDTDKSNNKKGSSPAKMKKSKGRPTSKDKVLKSKVDRQYKTGSGRKKSCDKVEPRKRSIDKPIAAKNYGINNEGSAIKSKTTISLNSVLPEEGSSVDRFDVVSEKILAHQLDECRFMYYLIKNSQHIPLPEDNIKRITLIIFKHLVKLIKQLSDTKINYLKIPNWDSFKQSHKYKTLIVAIQEYSEKYQREYLRFLKDSDIIVIKQVNQKFSELGNADPLTLSFYRKLQGLIASALKDSLSSVSSQEEMLTSKAKQNTLALKTLLRYYRWLEDNVKNFEKYALLLSNQIKIIKNYKTQEVGRQQLIDICNQIRQI